MNKKKSDKELNIDINLVEERTRQIGEALEGIAFPEILSILGTIIVELEYNAAAQNVNAAPVLLEWMEKVSAQVFKASVDLFEEKSNQELN